MRLGYVIGKAALGISDPALKGGRFLLVQPLSREQFSGAPMLPLAKGATWTYQAKILRFDEDAGKETATTLEWKTEVVEVIDGVVTAYVLKGWPSDLAAFDG